MHLKSFLPKETMGAFDGIRTHNWQLMSQTRFLLHHDSPSVCFYNDIFSLFRHWS